MKNLILFSITLFTFISQVSPATGTERADTILFGKPKVIIDSGHTNKMPGATSITGKREVEYNDKLVSKLADALANSGFAPILTRQPNQEVKLEDRANIANLNNAILMLSIHHDSAQPRHLEPEKRHGAKTYRTRKAISGYSLFVSRKNQQFDNSLVFAKVLGHELFKLGRKPSLHHAEPIPGERRPLLDVTLGIYQFDDLVVLKKSEIPAVLLEIGVLVDKDDEAYVTKDENQKAIVNAIVASIRKFHATIPSESITSP